MRAWVGGRDRDRDRETKKNYSVTSQLLGQCNGKHLRSHNNYYPRWELQGRFCRFVTSKGACLCTDWSLRWSICPFSAVLVEESCTISSMLWRVDLKLTIHNNIGHLCSALIIKTFNRPRHEQSSTTIMQTELWHSEGIRMLRKR